MAGNSFGQLFKVTTFGESHGPAYGCIIDGCPPGLTLSESDIQVFLDKRRPGTSAYTSPRQECDQVNILSGVFDGQTTGTPIGLLIKNTDQRSQDYAAIKDSFRPGHGDYTYHHKYGVRDYRGGGRASARETMMRVAAGAIARKFLLEKLTITIRGYLTQLGPIKAETMDWQQVNDNPFFFPDAKKIPLLIDYIEQLKQAGDSIGAQVLVQADNMPIGLGEPVFNKLDADIAAAMMSINAVKAVEIGDGIACIEQKGSEHRDELTPSGFLTNHAGGTLAGISSGQPLQVRIAVKPTSSIKVPGQSIDINNKPIRVSTNGRHDPCVGIRAVPVAEAMLALVVMDHVLRHRAQNG